MLNQHLIVKMQLARRTKQFTVKETDKTLVKESGSAPAEKVQSSRNLREMEDRNNYRGV